MHRSLFALLLLTSLCGCRVGPVEQCTVGLESNITSDARTKHLVVDCISDSPDTSGSYSCFCLSHEDGIRVPADDNSELEANGSWSTFSADDACTQFAALDGGEDERAARLAAAQPQLEAWCDVDLSSLPDDSVLSRNSVMLVGAHLDTHADRR